MADDAICFEECWTRANDELEFAIPVQTAFQEWCGVYGQDGAATLAQAYLFRDELDYPVSGEVYTPEELETLSQFAVFGSDTEAPLTIARGVGLGSAFVQSGTQFIHLERLVADSNYDTPSKRKAQRERSEYLIGRLACQLMHYFSVGHDEPGSGRHNIRQISVMRSLSETASEFVGAIGHWHKGVLYLDWGDVD